MKVSASHLEIMKSAISLYDTDETRARYKAMDIPRADSVKDINKRYRWDLYYHAARFMDNTMPDSTNGYNMNHIDTALKAIVKQL